MLKESLNQNRNDLSSKNSELEDVKNNFQYIEQQIETIDEMIQTYNPNNIFKKMKSWLNQTTTNNLDKCKEDKIKLLEERRDNYL